MSQAQQENEPAPGSVAVPGSEAPSEAASGRAMHGELKDYRQPLVTSLGIILGFLLSYLGGWAAASTSAGAGLLEDRADVAIFCTIVAAVAIFICVLYRMLNPMLPAGDPLKYYRLTLRLFILGIIVAFGGFLAAWVL